MCDLLAVSMRTLAVRVMQPNSQSQLNIITNTLGSAESPNSQYCANLKHLPEAIKDTFSRNTGTSTCVSTHICGTSVMDHMTKPQRLDRKYHSSVKEVSLRQY